MADDYASGIKRALEDRKRSAEAAAVADANASAMQEASAFLRKNPQALSAMQGQAAGFLPEGMGYDPNRKEVTVIEDPLAKYAISAPPPRSGLKSRPVREPEPEHALAGANFMPSQAPPTAQPMFGGGGGPVQKVAAEWTPGQRNIQHGMQYSQRTLGDLDEAAKAEDDALYWNRKQNANEQTLGILGSEQALQARTEHNQRKGDLYKQRAIKMDVARERIADAQGEYDRQSVDPDHLFKSKPGLGVLAVLGGALGGALKGYNHLSSNGFIDNLNQAIQTDIDAQKANLAKKGHKVDLATNAYARLKEQLGDDAAVEDQMYLDALEASSAKLKEMAAKANTPSTLAAEAKAQAEIKLKQAERRASIEDRQQDKVTESQHFTPEHYVGGGGGPNSGFFKADGGLMVDLGNGTSVVARTTQEAEKIRARKSFEQNIMGLQNEAKAVFQKYGKGVLVPHTEGWNALQAIKEQAIPIQSVATQQGVVREFERDPTLRGLGLGYGLKDAATGQDPMKQIGVAQRTLGMGSAELIRQQNGVIVRPTMVQNQRGDIEQKYRYEGQGYKPPPSSQEAPSSFTRNK